MSVHSVGLHYVRSAIPVRKSLIKYVIIIFLQLVDLKCEFACLISVLLLYPCVRSNKIKIEGALCISRDINDNNQ